MISLILQESELFSEIKFSDNIICVPVIKRLVKTEICTYARCYSHSRPLKEVHLFLFFCYFPELNEKNVNTLIDKLFSLENTCH